MARPISGDDRGAAGRYSGCVFALRALHRVACVEAANAGNPDAGLPHFSVRRTGDRVPRP